MDDKKLTPQEAFDRLNQPFDPADLKFKPQTVNYKAKTAMAVAHADPRAYIDRLNEVVGIDGWSSEIQFLATPFTKFIKGKKPWGAPKDDPIPEDKLVPGNKVLCICTVTINGIGSHTSTGDADASDENAATSAEAQAFKRACMQFGLGRYLYDLPKLDLPYDNGTWGTDPVTLLPEWALPVIPCEDCATPIKASVFNGNEYSATVLINNSQKKYGKKLCMGCQQKRSKAAAAK